MMKISLSCPWCFFIICFFIINVMHKNANLYSSNANAIPSLSPHSHFSKVKKQTRRKKEILNSKLRNSIQRIIIVDELPEMSYNIIQNSFLLSVLYQNFPHAEIIMYNGISPFIKAPYNRKFVYPKKKFIDSYQQWKDKKDTTLLFFFWENFNTDQAISKTITDSISLMAFNLNSFCYNSHRPVQIRSKQLNEIMSQPYSWDSPLLFKRQWHALKKLGLKSLPKHKFYPLLDETNFHPAILKEMLRIHAKIFKKQSEKPVIFVNLLKGSEGEWLYENQLRQDSKIAWVLALQKIVQELDVILILNEGPIDWRKKQYSLLPSPHEEIVAVYKSLNQTPHKKASIFRMNEIINQPKLAALLKISQLTGGCLIDIQTGTSILAQWMNIPEIVLVADRFTKDLYSRRNLIKIFRYYDLNTGRSTFLDNSFFSMLLLKSIQKLIKKKNHCYWSEFSFFYKAT